jgi:hypothetical protein
VSSEENKIFGNRTTSILKPWPKGYIFGFSNKKIGKDKQHERSIVSGEQRKKPICTQLWAYIFYHVQIFIGVLHAV